MIDNDLLTAKFLSSAEKNALRVRLTAVPWCWPTEPVRLERARDLATTDEPPALEPGVVPLLSVSDDSAALWAFGLMDSALYSVPLTNTAIGAWNVAHDAVPSALPFLWRSLRACWQSFERHAHLVASIGAPASMSLEGESLGLPLALALVSRVLGLPLLTDVAATATIDGTGKLGPVDGLSEKIACLERRAPGIGRLIVARDDSRAANECAETVTIVPAATLREAISEAFRDKRITEALERAGADRETREQLSHEIFLLATRDRRSTLTWAPVARATAHLLECWTDLSARGAYNLRFAEAIANRHDGTGITIEVPSHFAELPMPTRLACLAHLIQHTADTGQPDPEKVRQAAVSVATSLSDATEGHLRVRGALARLDSRTGSPRDAHDAQEELARHWLELGNHWEAGYPLAEWYRLAGALGDEDSLARADALTRRAPTLENIYVRLCRLWALYRLDPERPAADLSAGLDPILSGTQVPAHVSVSALRLRRRIAPAETDVRRHIGELVDDQPRSRALRALIAFDEAYLGSDSSATDEALNALARHRPFVDWLRQTAARNGEDEADYVDRYFPY